MRRVRLLIVLALGACSSYSSTSGVPSDAGVDAVAPPPPPSSADAGGGDDASDAGATNLLINGDFEQGCAAWQTNGFGTAQADSTARSGTGSCRLCYVGDASPGTNANLDQTVAYALHPSAHPFATVWVRTAPNGPAPVNVYARVTVGQSDGGSIDCTSAGHFPVSDTWQRIDPTCTDALDGTSLIVDIVADDGCVLVDDATLVVK